MAWILPCLDPILVHFLSTTSSGFLVRLHREFTLQYIIQTYYLARRRHASGTALCVSCTCPSHASMLVDDTVPKLRKRRRKIYIYIYTLLLFWTAYVEISPTFFMHVMHTSHHQLRHFQTQQALVLRHQSLMAGFHQR